MKFRTLLSGLLITVLLISGNVFAQEHSSSEIKSLLEERDEEIKVLLGPEGTEYTEEQREQLKLIINGIIDFEAMAKIALEETYDTISAESREEFLDLFSTIIRDQSLSKLEIYRASVSYKDIIIEDNTALVRTIAELDEVRTPVDYKLRYTGDEWVITDMSIDDVYTAESYNNQFQRIISKRDFEYLMERLRKRAAR